MNSTWWLFTISVSLFIYRHKQKEYVLIIILLCWFAWITVVLNCLMSENLLLYSSRHCSIETNYKICINRIDWDTGFTHLDDLRLGLVAIWYLLNAWVPLLFTLICCHPIFQLIVGYFFDFVINSSHYNIFFSSLLVCFKDPQITYIYASHDIVRPQ